MNYTPSGPKFENMRDGIIQHLGATNGAARVCHVWRAFAKFGVGVGAKATVKGGKVTVTQSFFVPAGCPAP